MRPLISNVPLLGVVAAAYLIHALLAGDAAARPLFALALPSGISWTFAVADLFVLAGLFLLYVEILKSTRTSGAQIVEHTLSVLVFVGCLLLFLLVGRAGTTTFFLLTVMALIDVIAGFTISIKAARRDFEIDKTAG